MFANPGRSYINVTHRGRFKEEINTTICEERVLANCLHCLCKQLKFHNSTDL